MKPYKRSVRVSQEVKRIIAETLMFDAKDPKLRRITVIRVDVSDDLRFAKVYYTDMLEEGEAESRLEHAKGFIRSMLAKKMHIKFVPEISFHKIKEMELL